MRLMAELKNTFSWSFSAAKAFDECRRRRYWAKYGMWGGWSQRAPESSRIAYRLSKMTSRFSVQGEAVEMAVLWSIRKKQGGIDVLPSDAYEAMARPWLRTCWTASRQGNWRTDPKRNCCLREHYYEGLGADKAREREVATEVAEAVKLCIGHAFEHVLPRLADVGVSQEVAVATLETGDPESFDLDGLKIYAIPDYVYVVNDDDWHIHDWKTGAAREEHHEQVAVYGLWAGCKHGAAAEALTLHLEYLRTGTTKETRFSESDAEAVRTRIRSSVAEMADYLVDGDVDRNEPMPMEEWEMAADAGVCRNCNFFELCRDELG